MGAYPTITHTWQLGEAVVDEFETHNAQLVGYLSTEHNGDGTHGDVTASSVTTPVLTADIYNAAVTVAPILTADQNNYNPQSQSATTDGILAISANAARNITGLAAPAVAGTRVTLWNVGAFPITLKFASALSNDANQFRLRSSSDYVLPVYGMAELIYLSSRWNGPVGA